MKANSELHLACMGSECFITYELLLSHRKYTG